MENIQLSLFDAYEHPFISLNLLSDTDLIDFTFEGNHFLAFRIPAAIRVQRPVYITTNPFDNTYKRNYEGDYKCTRKEGFLLSENKSRWTTYHLNTDYANDVEKESDTNLDTSAVNLDSSEISDYVPDYKNGKEIQESITLTPNLDTLTPNLDTSNQKCSKKLSKEELHKLIIEACKSNYITIEQIALAVNRSQAYLQNEVLPFLVSHGNLERLYPDNPNHPNQAYKTQAK